MKPRHSTPASFEVRSGRPVRRQRARYPFEAMALGDSFTAPDDMGEDKGKSNRRRSIQGAARGYRSDHDADFYLTTTRTTEDGKPVIVAWRVDRDGNGAPPDDQPAEPQAWAQAFADDFAKDPDATLARLADMIAQHWI